MRVLRVTIETENPSSQKGIDLQNSYNSKSTNALLQMIGLPQLNSASSVLEDLRVEVDEDYDIEEVFKTLKAAFDEKGKPFIRVSSWDELS